MKLRQGFISNSSSSSFIVKGYIINSDKINFDLNTLIRNICPEVFDDTYLKKIMNDPNHEETEISYEIFSKLMDKGWFFTKDEENGAPKNSFVMGKLLQDVNSEDGYIEDMIIDCSLDKDLQKIHDYLKRYKVEEPLKIIVGTRAC